MQALAGNEEVEEGKKKCVWSSERDWHISMALVRHDPDWIGVNAFYEIARYNEAL